MSRISLRHVFYLGVLPIVAASYAGTYDPLLLGLVVAAIIMGMETFLRWTGRV